MLWTEWLLPPQIPLLNPNSQGDRVRRWGLGEAEPPGIESGPYHRDPRGALSPSVCPGRIQEVDHLRLVLTRTQSRQHPILRLPPPELGDKGPAVTGNFVTAAQADEVWSICRRALSGRVGENFLQSHLPLPPASWVFVGRRGTWHHDSHLVIMW